MYNDDHGLSCNNDFDYTYMYINILQRHRHVPEFSENISIFEIEKAIKKTKSNKACGLDEIFRNITCMHFT